MLRRCTHGNVIKYYIRLYTPWHFLNFFPLPQGHGSFLPTSGFLDEETPTLFSPTPPALPSPLAIVFACSCTSFNSIVSSLTIFAPILGKRFIIWLFTTACISLKSLSPSFLYSTSGSLWP